MSRPHGAVARLIQRPLECEIHDDFEIHCPKRHAVRKIGNGHPCPADAEGSGPAPETQHLLACEGADAGRWTALRPGWPRHSLHRGGAPAVGEEAHPDVDEPAMMFEGYHNDRQEEPRLNDERSCDNYVG